MSSSMMNITIEIVIGIVMLSVVVLSVYISLIKLRGSKSNILKKYGKSDIEKRSSVSEKVLSGALFALIVLLIVLLIIV